MSQPLIDLLASKHAQDVFIKECKDGPTYSGNHLRLDAWAMPRSWSNAKSVGYDVKHSRSDYLGDKKWHGYLKYCNEFFFVTPPGLLDKSEVPAPAGLIEASKNFERLFVRKKCDYRDVQIPEDFYRYIIMCRAKITRDRTDESSASFWKDWLAKKVEDRSLGFAVSKAIQQTCKEKIYKVETENARLEQENRKLADIRATLKRLGFAGDWIPESYSIEQRMEQMKKLVPDDLLYKLRETESAIANLSNRLLDLTKNNSK